MEIRRLVKAGAVSYTVSLPKKWIDHNKLKKGDSIYIREESPKELIITADISQDRTEQREITINIDEKKLDSIRREITSAYLNNYNTITIIGKELDSNVLELRKILHDFVALEIVEQTSTKIIAKDFLNLKEVSIEKTITRMDMIVRSMMQDTSESIDGKDMYQSVYYRDFEVNRLYFMMLRLLKSCLIDPKVSSYFDMPNVNVLQYWNLTIDLENIADNTKNICNFFKESRKKSDEKTLKELYSVIHNEYLKAMKAHYKSDKTLAEQVAFNRMNIIKKIADYFNNNNNVITAQIIENMKETETFICNIARNVLDNS